MVVRAHEVMTRGVVSVSPGTAVGDARRILLANRFSALPVVDRGQRLVGIVTTYDVLRALTGARPPRTVGAIMTRDPLRMNTDADVRVLAHRLRRYGPLRAMPIVEHGVLAGIITRSDLLRPAVRGGKLGRLLHRATEPEPGGIDLDWDDEPRSGPTAADVMTPRPDLFAAGELTGTEVVAEVLRECRLTSLPVVDGDDRVVGVVSEADLVVDELSGRRTFRAVTVGEVMTRGATAVRTGVALEDVARALVDQHLRVLPVVDGHDRLVGAISRGDVLRALPGATRPRRAVSAPTSGTGKRRR